MSVYKKNVQFLRDLVDASQLPSIIGTLWKIFKFDLLGASGLKFICDLLQFANPGFLK